LVARVARGRTKPSPRFSTENIPKIGVFKPYGLIFDPKNRAITFCLPQNLGIIASSSYTQLSKNFS
jgi:hypothetical protein